ncbi:NUDIX hydrolase [Halomarina rubra]|uniref:NUDIX hydrolase n=1 Tax=Halomarina rubra TaxID=2071873 RepID=A0ABD6AWM3_9EURY|nr:NUDIX domain-containing protein [Halomarina rubra]
MTDSDPAYLVNVDAVVVRDGEYLLVERSPDEEHAAGELGFPGGTTDGDDEGPDVLEATVRREVREEVGVELATTMAYVQSNAFESDTGEGVVNVVFLCRYERGEVSVDPTEVAEVHWLTAEAVANHPETPAYTRQQLELAEGQRQLLGW